MRSVITWYLSFPEMDSILPEAENYRPADLKASGQAYLEVSKESHLFQQNYSWSLN